MQKDKLSKCATTVLLVCCYLYHKRNYANNVNAKLRSKVEICKLPSTTLIFLPRYREARKLPPSPRWSPSQGIPRKGPAPSRVTLWIASGLPHAQVGLRRAFRQASPGCSPPSSLSSLRSKRRGPYSLRYRVAATPQTRLV